MASSTKCPNWVNIAAAAIVITMMLFFSLTFFPSISADESMLVRDGDHESLKKEMKMVLGSSPPRCVNKCMGCRPCAATLVVSPHHKTSPKTKAKTTTFHYQGDESYYLLSWKCKCRNKLFQP